MLRSLIIVNIAIAAMVAPAAFADTTSGPVNSLPKVDIVQDNGSPNAKGLSFDPQIAACVFDATGTTAATTSFTTFADAAHYTCTAWRGALIGNSTTGRVTITRSGLYRVGAYCNGTGTTTNTMTQEAAISLDSGSTWTQIAGSQSVGIALTGDLQKNMGSWGYVSVGTTGAAAGTTMFAMRGKNSANTTTCAAGGGLFIERVDQLQPSVYP